MLRHGPFKNVISDNGKKFGPMFNSICKTNYILIQKKIRHIILEQINVSEQIGAFELKNVCLTYPKMIGVKGGILSNFN